MVGARSALFLPYAALGLIVVDEAHEVSFKQDDGVRYNGRDVAVIRARFEGIPVILASATPALESLTLAEAGNDLAFVVTGVYGKPLPNQFGAPIRIAVPWKYGFKSAKSIVKVSFMADRPKTFWEGLQASEYGFWANVNPAVPHPRWSQASERVLGTDTRVPTLIYNGYGEQVAGLYKDLQGERLFV